MTLFEAFNLYIHDQIPLAVDATITVEGESDRSTGYNVLVRISGDSVHALYIANGIHSLLCNTSNVLIGDGRYLVALAYSPLYCPLDVGEIGEYKYQIPVDIQYIDNGDGEQPAGGG